MLHNFSSDLVVGLLIDWLDVNTLAYLDSAYCCFQFRPDFLSALRAKEFVLCNTFEDIVDKDKLESALKWISLRHVKGRSLTLSAALQFVPTHVVVDFVQVTGGDHVHSLEMKGFQGNSVPFILGAIAIKCKSLQSVVISDCSNVSGLDLVLRSSKDTLETLGITRSGVDAVDLQGLILLNVTYLCVSYLQQNTNCATKLLRCLPNLVLVSMIEVPMSDNCLRVLSERAQRVHTLILFYCGSFSSAILHALASRCSKLEKLHLYGTSCSDAAVEAFTAKCPLLHTLFLCKDFTEAALLLIATHCGTRLRHLTLYEMEGTSDVGITALATSCTALVTLRLPKLSGVVSQTALTSFVTAQERLLLLDVSNCVVSDSLLLGLAEHCPLLQQLSLYNTSGFSATGAMSVVLGCRELRLVGVKEDNAVVTEMARALWKQMVPQVKFMFTYFDFA